MVIVNSGNQCMRYAEIQSANRAPLIKNNLQATDYTQIPRLNF